MIVFILALIGALAGSLLGNYLWHRRKWNIAFNEQKKEFYLYDEPKGDEVEFLPDATQEELDEMERPEWKKFLDSVRREK